MQKSEITTAIGALNELELQEYLQRLDKEGKSYSFLQEAEAMITEISTERAKVIIRALFNSTSELNAKNTGFLSLGAGSFAVFFLIDLLRILEYQERIELLTAAINTSTIYTISTPAIVLTKIEVGYGKFNENEGEIAENEIVTMEDLPQLENVFNQKAKKMLETNNLFDFTDWKTVCYLMEYIDPDYMQNYYTESFENNKNVVLYFSSSVSEWVGSGTLYEIRNDYQKYLSTDRVIHALEALKASGELFELPETVQNKCVALPLFLDGKNNNHGHIPLFEVEKLLREWRSQAGIEEQ